VSVQLTIRPVVAASPGDDPPAGYRADIVLDRPEVLNAMNWDVFTGLDRVAGEVAAHDDIRVAVVSGSGRAFSSGIDTALFGAELPGEDLIAQAQAGIRKLAALPMPVIAAIRGHAYGAGLQLALSCDLRLVTPDAQLGLLEAKYGLIPDLGGTHLLAALAGPAVAKQMMWLAEKISGTEAHRRGIAQFVVEDDKLEETVDDLAARLAAAPPLVVRGVKTLVERAATSTFTESMDEVARLQTEVMASADFGEAISAFLQGRAPLYRGH
jgi:enoyl-CoA hydratase/carnithine racemase